MAIVRTGHIALFRDIRLALSSNTIIRDNARSALVTALHSEGVIGLGGLLSLGVIVIWVKFTTVFGISPLTTIGGIAIGLFLSFCQFGSTYRGSNIDE